MIRFGAPAFAADGFLVIERPMAEYTAELAIGCRLEWKPDGQHAMRSFQGR
jgi:hypothetical protein